MQVIAKTREGYLICATKEEVSAIMESVSKPVDDKNPIAIGDKIPAYDYASMIKQCKAFRDTLERIKQKRYDFITFKEVVEALNKSGTGIVNAIETLKFE